MISEEPRYSPALFMPGLRLGLLILHTVCNATEEVDPGGPSKRTQKGRAGTDARYRRAGRAELLAVEVDGAEASLAARYWARGIARFLETGDTDVLKEFEDERVGGVVFETDPDAIEEFEDRYGRFDFQEVYQS